MPSDLIRGWEPVRVKETRQQKRPESGFDSIEVEQALALPGAGANSLFHALILASRAEQGSDAEADDRVLRARRFESRDGEVDALLMALVDDLGQNLRGSK